MKIDIEEGDIKLFKEIKDNWHKLGLGLDASGQMISLMNRAAQSYKEEINDKRIKAAKKIIDDAAKN